MITQLLSPEDYHTWLVMSGRTRRILLKKLEVLAASMIRTSSRFSSSSSTSSSLSCVQEMATETGADLENIVYYKEETHYFVMTAKKESLLKFGVLKEDIPDEEGPGGD